MNNENAAGPITCVNLTNVTIGGKEPMYQSPRLREWEYCILYITCSEWITCRAVGSIFSLAVLSLRAFFKSARTMLLE